MLQSVGFRRENADLYGTTLMLIGSGSILEYCLRHHEHTHTYPGRKVSHRAQVSLSEMTALLPDLTRNVQTRSTFKTILLNNSEEYKRQTPYT